MTSNFHIIRHALISDKLAILRNTATSCVEFKRVMCELGMILGSEVLRDEPTKPCEVTTPCGTAHCEKLKEDYILVPILRAGLGLADGVSAIFPQAAVGHIGLYRDETTHYPVPYMEKLPQLRGKRIIVIDPMVATGRSAVKAVGILVRNGAQLKSISLLTLLCSPEGRDTFCTAYPGVDFFTGALDERLNENAFIVPGLGDAGDRLFGTL